jgi:hypothetical protein
MSGDQNAARFADEDDHVSTVADRLAAVRVPR